MEDALREQLTQQFDSHPVDPEGFREIVRKLVARLPSLSTLEAEIMAWDAAGRGPGQLDELANRAWDFSEVDGIAWRKRLFSGFVTNGDITDGYGADFLIDCALGAGISAADTFEIMSRGTKRD